MKFFQLPDITHEKDYLKILGPAGEIFEFIRSGKSTNGEYIISKTIVPPGAGPTPHFHHENDEWFYTPRGGIVLFTSENEYLTNTTELDKEPIKQTLCAINMQAGQLVYVPRKHFHAFINNTNESHLLYMIWTPDKDNHSLAEYFKHVGQPIDDIHHTPPIEPLAKLKFVSEAHKFGIKQSHHFWQYVSDIDYSEKEFSSNDEALLSLIKNHETIS